MNIINYKPFKTNPQNVRYVEKILNQFINHNSLNIFVKLNHVKIF